LAGQTFKVKIVLRDADHATEYNFEVAILEIAQETSLDTYRRILIFSFVGLFLVAIFVTGCKHNSNQISPPNTVPLLP
jgi:hypothetical protein